MDPVVRQSLRTGRVRCKFRDPSLPMPVEGALFCKHRHIKLCSLYYGQIEASLADLLPPEAASPEDEVGFCVTLHYKVFLPDGRVAKDERSYPIQFWVSSESLRTDVVVILHDRQQNPVPRPLFRQFQGCVGGALGSACGGLTHSTMFPMRRKSCVTPVGKREAEEEARHREMGVPGSRAVEDWLRRRSGGPPGGDFEAVWAEISDFGRLKSDFVEQCPFGMNEERFGWFLVVTQDESGNVAGEVFRKKRHSPFVFSSEEVGKLFVAAAGIDSMSGGGHQHQRLEAGGSRGGGSVFLPRAGGGSGDHLQSSHGAGSRGDHSLGSEAALNLFGFRQFLCDERNNSIADESLAEGVLGLPKPDQNLAHFVVSTGGPRLCRSLEDLSAATKRHRCLTFFFLGDADVGGQVLLVPDQVAASRGDCSIRSSSSSNARGDSRSSSSASSGGGHATTTFVADADTMNVIPVRISVRDFLHALVRVHGKDHSKRTNKDRAFPLAVVLLHAGAISAEVHRAVHKLCDDLFRDDILLVDDANCGEISTAEHRILLELSGACADPYLLCVAKPSSGKDDLVPSSKRHAVFPDFPRTVTTNNNVAAGASSSSVSSGGGGDSRRRRASPDATSQDPITLVTVPGPSSLSNRSSLLLDPARLWQRGVHRVALDRCVVPENAIFAARGFCARQHIKQIKAWRMEIVPVLIERNIRGVGVFYEEGVTAGGGATAGGGGGGGDGGPAGNQYRPDIDYFAADGGTATSVAMAGTSSDGSSSAGPPAPGKTGPLPHNDNGIHRRVCDTWRAHGGGSKRTLSVRITIKSVLHPGSMTAESGPNCFDGGRAGSVGVVPPAATHHYGALPGRGPVVPTNGSGTNGAAPGTFRVKSELGVLKLKCPHPESSVMLLEVLWSDPLTSQQLLVAHACHRLLSIRPGLRWVAFPGNAALRGMLLQLQIS